MQAPLDVVSDIKATGTGICMYQQRLKNPIDYPIGTSVRSYKVTQPLYIYIYITCGSPQSRHWPQLDESFHDVSLVQKGSQIGFSFTGRIFVPSWGTPTTTRTTASRTVQARIEPPGCVRPCKADVTSQKRVLRELFWGTGNQEPTGCHFFHNHTDTTRTWDYHNRTAEKTPGVVGWGVWGGSPIW